MNLSDYIKDQDQRRRLAAAVESSPDYLYQIATGHRRASTGLAQRIDAATHGVISKASLRPDVWGVCKAA